jgi:hypothetical protein
MSLEVALNDDDDQSKGKWVTKSRKFIVKSMPIFSTIKLTDHSNT